MQELLENHWVVVSDMGIDVSKPVAKDIPGQPSYPGAMTHSVFMFNMVQPLLEMIHRTD